MGHHIIKCAKLNFVARHYDPYVQGHKGHNGVRQNSLWLILLCGDPYDLTHDLNKGNSFLIILSRLENQNRTEIGILLIS